MPPVSGGGNLPYPPSTKLPQTHKVCSGDEAGPAKASCKSPATGHTRPGDAAPTLARALELHALCAWTQSIAPRSAAGEMARRAAGTRPSRGRGQPAGCTAPSAGVGSSSPRRCSSRRLPGRQQVPLSAHAGSTTEGQVFTE